ncbi:MAG: hypothetical protein ACR2MS_07765 [Weeksellaceae bacterium]
MTKEKKQLIKSLKLSITDLIDREFLESQGIHVKEDTSPPCNEILKVKGLKGSLTEALRNLHPEEDNDE